jgi:hypothetical protein
MLFYGGLPINPDCLKVSEKYLKMGKRDIRQRGHRVGNHHQVSIGAPHFTVDFFLFCL